MTADLVAWLRRQLDHDEQVARAALDEPSVGTAWRADDDGKVVAPFGDRGEYRLVLAEVVEPAGFRVGQHIALNDPAHVLRVVAAHRGILERHRPVAGSEHVVCEVCSFTAWDDESLLGDPFPCPDVRTLASIYDQREGFDPAWKVDG